MLKLSIVEADHILYAIAETKSLLEEVDSYICIDADAVIDQLDSAHEIIKTNLKNTEEDVIPDV